MPTFHSDRAGLAWDFCKNVKGSEYSDPDFFRRAAALAKEMGFTWGGDWKSFPDSPHIQWDGRGQWTSSMILAGKLPPEMPLYREETDEQEDEEMDAATFKKLWQEMRRELQDNDSSAYSQEARAWAVEGGLVSGAGDGKDGEPNYMWEDVLTREQLVTVLYRFAKKAGLA